MYFDISKHTLSQFEIDTLWKESFNSSFCSDLTIFQTKDKQFQKFDNYLNEDKIIANWKELLREREESKLLSDNFQLKKDKHFAALDTVEKNILSKVVANFYYHLHPDKYTWNKIEIDSEDELCIKFISEGIEVSISIEDLDDTTQYSKLDSYLSIFRNGRRTSYNRPLESLIGILNGMTI